MEEKLQQIRDFAAEAHKGQKRKYSPEEFIQHPIRVMETCKEYTNDITILAAALLHDVLEDTDVTKDDLHNQLSKVLNQDEADRTVKLVVELTDVFIKADYPRLNRRKRKQKEADRIEKTSGASQTVKYADIIDNTSEIVESDPEFAKRFLSECRNLLQRMKKGDEQLYHRAVTSVNTMLEKLKKKGVDDKNT